MKANELMCESLMIGDWFNFLIDIEGGDTEYDPKNEIYQPMQVDSIGLGAATSEEGVTNAANQLQPIPLTTEILEKNFKSKELPDDPYGAYFFGGNDYIEVYIKEYTDGLWQVEIDEIEMDGLPCWRMYVSDLYELQHALRLCGIDKEIEL